MNEKMESTERALEEKLGRPDIDWEPRSYQNKHKVWGYEICFWGSGQHHMISIHKCEQRPSPADILRVIRGIEWIDPMKMGNYPNKNGELGFYATALSRNSLNESSTQWCMVARSPERICIPDLTRGNRISQEIGEMFDLQALRTRAKPITISEMKKRNSEKRFRGN